MKRFSAAKYYNYISIHYNIKQKKKKSNPINKISEEDIEFFLDVLEKSTDYIKVRNLQKMMGGKFNTTQINTIFKYLERAKLIETDLEGNIIWIKTKKTNDHQTLGDIINKNEQVKNLLKYDKDE